MSYILEALKKAEQARGHGKAPGLFAVQTGAPPARGKAVWPWLAAALIAINAAALFYWFQRPLPREPGAMAERPAAEIAPTAPTVASSPPMAVAPRQPEQQAAVKLAPSKPVSDKPESLKTKETKTPARTQLAPATLPSPTQSILSAPAAIPPLAPPTPAQERVPQLAELPPDIQQEVAKMAVAMHMYSGKPANRLVTVNDKPLREGDELSPGLRLIEITPDGMIFSYKAFKFRKGIP